MHINDKIDIATTVVSGSLTVLLIVAGFAFMKDMMLGIQPLISYFGSISMFLLAILFADIASMAYDNFHRVINH